jgi:hypothetical protein
MMADSGLTLDVLLGERHHSRVGLEFGRIAEESDPAS